MGASHSLQDTVFDMKMTAKTLTRNHNKCLKNEKVAKAKLKDAIAKGNIDGARIYAENAIREKQQAANFLRLSSRMDAVASQVEMALMNKELATSMGKTVKGMSGVLKSMDPVKMTSMMDQFESQLNDLGVSTAYMSQAIGNATSDQTPTEAVDDLIAQTADENELELGEAFTDLKPSTVKPSEAAEDKAVDQTEDLEARLAKLRG